MKAEEQRLDEARGKTAPWKKWGAYVSERAWGTVREDYSADGSAWEYFPFEHAHSRTFRWNEDGLAGFCDSKQRICFALSLWNETDPILKERLFGLTGNQGNHGEDVKEYYFYLDATPTQSYAKFLYKYPQAEFPYRQLLEETRRRGKTDAEYELLDTGVFDDNRYFDVFVEYAKNTAEDIFIRITAHNRGEEAAPLHILPTVWFRNEWSWFSDIPKPRLEKFETDGDFSAVKLNETKLGEYFFYAHGAPELLFCENETNLKKLYGVENASKYVKDGVNKFIVHGNNEAVNPENFGTKASAHYELNISTSESAIIYLRLTKNEMLTMEKQLFQRFAERLFADRKQEADEFYAEITPSHISDDAKNIMRQSFAGMIWSKQYYHFNVKRWLDGDPAQPAPPAQRKKGRNKDWTHLNNSEVISMPDKWEYPWYAAWDLAFHCIPLAIIDSDFAKRQLILMLREWYMHPNGQLPAYEWAFSDVNPPVHAWAALRVFQIERKRRGKGDFQFLEKVFHKLLLNFTWWVNRKDPEDNNVFSGGFLGMDNIGIFDRNMSLPGGGHLEQSDGTSWMAMYCLNLMAIALELAKHSKAYEDVATKFFEHFIYIADAMNNMGAGNVELWSEEDGFFYDVLHLVQKNQQIKLRVRSMVGLIPLLAVETIDADMFEKLPEFGRRVEWFLNNRPDLTDSIACMQSPGQFGRRLLAIPGKEKLERILRVLLDETEFLSEYGIRSVSRFHERNPYILRMDGETHRVDYEPAESRSGMFGGNSNWRGPVWFPVNYLLIEALQKFDYYFGQDLQVEFPTGSGEMMTLWKVSQELEKRLARLFLKQNDRRAVYGAIDKFQLDEHWRDYILFYEYFHGDNGAGLGASHQTGWTGLIAKIIQQMGDYGTEV